MRIAYIVPSLVNKGPVVVVNTIVKNLIGKVALVDVYFFDDDLLPFPCATFKIDMNISFDFDDYDIIHSHGYRPDKYVNKWRKKIKKAKTISTIHSDIAQDLKFSYNRIVSLIFTPLWLYYLRNNDAVTVISKKLEKTYHKNFKKLYCIYNGVDIDLNESNSELKIINEISKLKSRGEIIIGTYASITKIKGIDQMINLLNFRDDVSLVVFGEGNEKKALINQAMKLGLSDRVLFFPYVKSPYSYISLFDVYAMPSRSEGFGLALVEAALTKAAIVCSDIEVFHEIFNEEQVSFFKLEDPKSLSSAVDCSILAGKEKGLNAYNHAMNFFSGEIMASNYIKLYQLLLN
nr:glycosyltransferase family 4 protein [uncultured Flavobacterium sp.]